MTAYRPLSLRALRPGHDDRRAVIDIGSNRELFVDEYLIDNLDGARMVLHHPRNEGPVMMFDKPWEGFFCGHFSVIKDGAGSGTSVACVVDSARAEHRVQRAHALEPMPR